jgi:hypothetical protein
MDVPRWLQQIVRAAVRAAAHEVSLQLTETVDKYGDRKLISCFGPEQPRRPSRGRRQDPAPAPTRHPVD